MARGMMVNICGREYKIKVTGEDGGCFWTQGSKGDGNGEINIGDYGDTRFFCEILLHELIEAIMVEERRRFTNEPSPNHQFVFDHEFLDTFCPKLLTAMLSSGFFKIKDARPKRKGKK